jgi:hypothetical protein
MEIFNNKIVGWPYIFKTKNSYGKDTYAVRVVEKTVLTERGLFLDKSDARLFCEALRIRLQAPPFGIPDDCKPEIVTSSNITAIGTTSFLGGGLVVLYSDQSVYLYLKMSSHFEKIAKTDSVGKYIAKYIKSSYFVKLY